MSDDRGPSQASSLPEHEPWTIARGLEMREHAADAIGSSLDWLSEQLAARKRPVVAGSALHLAFLRCRELRRCFEVHRGPRLTPRQELKFFGDAFGIDWMSKLLHRAVLDGLQVPQSLWSALGDPRADVIITRAGSQSKSRDLVWELILGALCSRVATSVVFAEPDVRCEFQGHTIAIAAKVSYRSRNLWINAVEKGMSQANGRGSVGLVAVNAASVAPLGSWLRACKQRGFTLGPRAGEWASAKTAQWCEHALRVAPAMVTLANVPAMPTGVVFFLPILLSVADQPGPFFYLHMPATWQGEHGPDFQFVSALCETSKTSLDRVE
jgi:hypothetical protein